MHNENSHRHLEIDDSVPMAHLVGSSASVPRYCFLASGLRDSAGNEAMDGCEDAEPLIERLSDGRVLACVADGLGGYSQGFDGKSGGFIASRAVTRGTFEFFQRYPQKSPELDAYSLTEFLYHKLRRIAALNLAPSRVKGTLAQHKLASTLACMVIHPTAASRKATVRLYWIGDSRIYFLSYRGLHLLTRDDTRADVDAYEGLFQDSPMSQFLAASMQETWRINAREISLQEPGVLLACTDGCTAYWKRPWDFEVALMDAFEAAENWHQWVLSIKERLASVRADDASLIAWPLTHTDFTGFREGVLDKHRRSPASKAARNAAVGKIPDQQIWRKIYRASFEKMLGEPDRHVGGWQQIFLQLKQLARSLWPFT